MNLDSCRLHRCCRRMLPPQPCPKWSTLDSVVVKLPTCLLRRPPAACHAVPAAYESECILHAAAERFSCTVRMRPAVRRGPHCVEQTHMRSPSGRRFSVQLASMDRSESTTFEIVSAGDLQAVNAASAQTSHGRGQAAVMVRPCRDETFQNPPASVSALIQDVQADVPCMCAIQCLPVSPFEGEVHRHLACHVARHPSAPFE